MTLPIPRDRAVVDRIVDGNTAVLLVGPEGTELHLPAEALPDGATDGTWVVLDLEEPDPAVTAIDHELTDTRAQHLSARLARIRKERTGGRFGR